MLPRLVHYSVSFIHISETGIMDGFHNIDVHAFSEERAIEKCKKKFKKLHAIEMICVPDKYYDSWHITCEVI